MFVSGPTLYSYVWNNPTNNTDPTGFLTAQETTQALANGTAQTTLANGTTVGLKATFNADGSVATLTVTLPGESTTKTMKFNGVAAGSTLTLMATRGAGLTTAREATLAAVANASASQTDARPARCGTVCVDQSTGEATAIQSHSGNLVQDVMRDRWSQMEAGGWNAVIGFGKGWSELSIFAMSSFGVEGAALAKAPEVEKVAEAEFKLIQTSPKNLVPQQTKSEMTGSVIKRLAKDMKVNGYDQSQPITAVTRSDGKLVISDGHHRAAAAIRAGIEKVPVEVYTPPSP